MKYIDVFFNVEVHTCNSSIQSGFHVKYNLFYMMILFLPVEFKDCFLLSFTSSEHFPLKKNLYFLKFHT